MMRFRLPHLAPSIAALSALAMAFACGSSSSDGSGSGASSAAAAADKLTYTTSAAVSGMADDHCDVDGSVMVQTVSQAACTLTGDAGQTDMTDYGATMYGSSGSDDDCKYHVSWTSSPVGENADVWFRVTATVAAAMNAPLTGATPILEVFESATHPAPNTNQSPTEESPGVYLVGPIRFDAAGKWTVRFHFNESCSDVSPESPHGHAAFYVNVP